MKITLRQLEVFAAVASYGNVTRAADSISLTQAAASMAVADLESQLGVKLFDRTGRHLYLNENGQRILPRALEVLDRIQEIEAGVRGTTPLLTLRLGTSLTIGNHLLPPLLAELKRGCPTARIRLSLRNTEQVQEDLLAFRIDVGFIEGFTPNDRLRHFAWHNDQLCIFAPPDHPLVHRTATALDLTSSPWVVRERGSGTREVFDRAMGGMAAAPDIALELEHPETIRQAVRAGMGLGCLSDLDLRDAFQAGWLAPIKTPFLDMTRTFHVVIHPDKHISRGMAQVLALCGIAPELS
jgi:DNA-binding transcriptional LysR family regulator